MDCRRFLMGLALAVLAPTVVAAQSWPTGPIRWIVPYPPGGGNDSISRLMAGELETRLGVPIVVDNKGGANGTIGLNTLRQAKADGLTVSTVPSGPLDVNPALNASLAYDPIKDFTYVGSMIKFPLFLVASHRSGIKTMDDLIAKARKDPGSVTYSSAGVGNSTHLAGALLGQLTNTDLLHVPYTGTGPAAVAVAAGDVDLSFGSGPSIMPMVRAGKVHLIGVGDAERLPNMPEVATLAEQGVPQYEAYSWAGVIAPTGVADDTVQAISQAIHDVVTDADFQQRIFDNGMVPLPGSSDEFRRIVLRDTEKWGRLIKAANISQ